MMKRKKCNEETDWNGFHLKPGHWYGDNDGQPVVTNGLLSDGDYMYLYLCTHNLHLFILSFFLVFIYFEYTELSSFLLFTQILYHYKIEKYKFSYFL